MIFLKVCYEKLPKVLLNRWIFFAEVVYIFEMFLCMVFLCVFVFFPVFFICIFLFYFVCIKNICYYILILSVLPRTIVVEV